MIYLPANVDGNRAEMLLIKMIDHLVFCQSQIDILNDSTHLCASILASTSSREFAPFPAQVLVCDTSTERT